MSLSSVIQIAQNSLSNMTRRTSVLARNINDSGNENYARRDLQSVSLLSGSRAANIIRASDVRLERASMDASSSNAAQSLLANRLSALNGQLANESGALSVSNHLTALYNSIQTFSAAPENGLLGSAAINQASELVAGLHAATAELQEFRTGIDQEIGETVEDLNQLLIGFKEANDAIRLGTVAGQDVNDALDRRSALLNSIAKIVPVSTLTRNNNDMVLLTASGATLFETEPRTVSFTPQTAMAAGTAGNPVFIDVVKLNFGNTPNASASGSLDALLRLRDTVAPTIQRQMDETARSLISAFSEVDRSGAGLARLQGLFTWPSGPAFPSAGTLIDGLAGTIGINAAYDPARGGSINRLRDGGANGAAYNANAAGLSGFSDRLLELSGSFDTAQPFDAFAGLGTNVSLLAFTSGSSGWFAGTRSNAWQNADLADAKYARIQENLSNATGVNMDTEMAKLGELEHGYEASARLLQVADQMLQSLLDALR